jgi:hypothetical protein
MLSFQEFEKTAVAFADLSQCFLHLNVCFDMIIVLKRLKYKTTKAPPVPPQEVVIPKFKSNKIYTKLLWFY